MLIFSGDFQGVRDDVNQTYTISGTVAANASVGEYNIRVVAIGTDYNNEAFAQITVFRDWTDDNAGTEGDPYIIATTADLDLLAQRVNSGTGDDYTAIGYYNYPADYYFNGHFDGANHVIKGIRIYKGTGETDCNQGLFGRINSSAEVSGIILADASITGFIFEPDGPLTGDDV